MAVSEQDLGSGKYKFCPSCGSAAVPGSSFCGACGRSLLKQPSGLNVTPVGPTPSGDDQSHASNTTWDLSDWDDSIKDELTAALINAEIPHHWERMELITQPAYEQEVDEILDELCKEPDDIGGAGFVDGYSYAQGLTWRQVPSGEWQWKAADGSWHPQAIAPRVKATTSQLTWRQNPSGAWEWLSDNGGWLPQSMAPLLSANMPGVSVPASVPLPVPNDTTPFGAYLAVIAGVVMSVGSFLPWITAHVGLVSLNRNAYQLGNDYGFSIDGVIVLVMGVITVAIGISRYTRFWIPRWIQRSSIVTGLVGGLVALGDISSIDDLAHKVESASSSLVTVTAGVGYGLPITVVGAGLAIIAGFVLRNPSSQ